MIKLNKAKLKSAARWAWVEVNAQKVSALTPRSLAFFPSLRCWSCHLSFSQATPSARGSVFLPFEFYAIILDFPLEQLFFPLDHSHLTTWASGLSSNTRLLFFFVVLEIGSSASASSLLGCQAGATLPDSITFSESNNFMLTCLSLICLLAVSLTKWHASLEGRNYGNGAVFLEHSRYLMDTLNKRTNVII